MKSIRVHIPNIITFINLSLGIIAIIMAVNEEVNPYLFYSSLLIMVAAVMDRVDGKIARMLSVTSELGKQLDSLSDLISFGVAPIIVSWKINLTSLGMFGYLIVLMFPIAGAYRLARYNISTTTNIYMGIPITIAGAFLTIINLFNCFSIINSTYSFTHTIITTIIIAVLSFLMVSKLKIKRI